MQQALIRSSDWPPEGGTTALTNNATASYYIVGDADSVAAVMETLVRSCSVVNASGIAIEVGYFKLLLLPNFTGLYAQENSSTVHVEQAVQYYRASSFMLALSSYNNSASLPSNAPADNNTAPLPPSADTTLPLGTNLTFLKCLNETIGASVPIMDAEPSLWDAATFPNVMILVWLVMVLWSLLEDLDCSCRRSRSGYTRLPDN